MKFVLSAAKRKTAVARVMIKEGKGRVYVNDVPLELHQIELFRNKIMEPLLLLGTEYRGKVDIIVRVSGGGVMSQADAARTAISRGLVKYFESEQLKKIFLEYDRVMLAGDPRQ
ncbi:MAG: 30S ribosomal protein S9, partial [Fervidicoccaceae archaeon]